MNREQVKTALAEFVEAPALRVAALSGDWGIGKTYLWTEFVKTLVLPKALNSIGYISLFGVTSLDELRLRVAMGLVRKRMPFGQAVLAFFKWLWRAGKWVVLGLIPWVFSAASRRSSQILARAQRYAAWKAGPLIGDASYWLVRNSIVALDDLERCSLETLTLLGFVDELRNRGCKIVLITNREKLKGDATASEIWAEHWEKVVDLDLKLAPDPQENAAIEFGSTFHPAAYASHARVTLAALGCTNIRIHKRVVWLIGRIDKIAPTFSKLPTDAQAQVLVNATVLCWLHLEPSAMLMINVALKHREHAMWAGLVPSEKLSDADRQWLDILEATNFAPHDFNTHLASLLTTGWCSPVDLTNTLNAFNDEREQTQAVESLRELQRRYADTFDISREEYLERFMKALRSRMRWVYVHEFDSHLVHLRKCNGNGTGELAREYIAMHGDHLDEVAEARDKQPIADPVLAADVKRREEIHRANRHTIDGVATHLALANGHSNHHIEYLANRKVDEYVEWIDSKPKGLRGKLDELLRFRENKDGANMEKIGKLIVEALQRVAARSAWNAERIENVYKVAVPAKPAMSSD